MEQGKTRIVHFSARFILALWPLSFAYIAVATAQEIKNFDTVNPKMFNACIKTDIFETNRHLGYSEYGQGNIGTMTIKALGGATVATLDYVFEPADDDLSYKLTWALPGTRDRVWAGLEYTVSECKKRTN